MYSIFAIVQFMKYMLCKLRYKGYVTVSSQEPLF